MSAVMNDETTLRGTKRTADEAGFPTPKRIKPLDSDVVNKIAAGEIIVAPVNALKEMMENSVDAGAKIIDILVRDGGLKMLQITDNGHGIEKDDLSILCERHTTSKLKDFDDLKSIATYGFRGEALASISHVAHLKVTTKTAGSSCAWQAHYQAGKLIPAKPGQTADPKPTAGRPGTQICVEDLFYNIPNRRRAFRSPSEEYTKILDMVTQHAVHCESVSFSIKKHGEAGAGFTVSAAASKLDRIRQAYGASVAKELIPFETASEKWGFKASGYCTTANHNGKRTNLLLFINHRAVESSYVKRAIEGAYQFFLPKGAHPFVYLSLEISPDRVDVNIHPTKKEVHFLNEDEIIELVCEQVKEQLSKVDASREFKTQTLIPTISRGNTQQQTKASSGDAEINTSIQPRTPATKKPYEHNLIRTDSKLRKITSMLPPALTPNHSVDEHGKTVMGNGAPAVKYYNNDREYVGIRLTSIKALRARVRQTVDDDLTEIFASLTYVGLVDPTRRLAAMQSGVNLYLVDYGMLVNELFYQIGITDFGNFGTLQLRPTGSPPLSLKEILVVAAEVQAESDPSMEGLDTEEVAEKVFKQLYEKKDMLREYFNMQIDDDGNLIAIPLLMKNYLPSMAKLPTFLLRLGPFVNWTSEEDCFRTFLIELAGFYVPEVLPFYKFQAQGKEGPGSSSPSKGQDIDVEMSDGSPDEVASESSENPIITKRRQEVEHALEHVLFPAIRSRLLATRGMRQGVTELANLKGLYKVFERC